MPNHLSFDTLCKLVEGRASAIEQPKAGRHLASCGRCRSELEWLQRIQTFRGETVGSDTRRTELRSVDSHLME